MEGSNQGGMQGRLVLYQVGMGDCREKGELLKHAPHTQPNAD